MSTMTTLAKIGPGCAGMELSAEEFDEIDDYEDGFRYELIRGVLIVSPSPLEEERGPNEELGRLLGNYQEDDPRGAAIDGTLAEHTIDVGSNRRRADRAIWAGLGRMPHPRHDAPTIVVEFVSADRRDWIRDYVDKKREYLAIGVVEYWVIDRFRRTLTVFRQSPAVPSEEIVPESRTYQTPLLPGFELPLRRLLAVADRWAGVKGNEG